MRTLAIRNITGFKLKIYACVSMTFYTVAMSVIQNGIIHVNNYTQPELAQLLSNDSHMMFISGWASVFQLISGLGVPVFAFLLVEGFLHTSDFKNYLLTMAGFALISEAAYDFAMNGVFLDAKSQNPLFTMTICLIMLYGLRMQEEKKGILRRLVQLIIVLAALFWVVFLRCAFGLCTVILVAIYYLMRDHKGGRLLLGCMISLMYVTGPLSTYILHSYNGDRGWNKNKYIFYIYYPLHLLIFGIAAYILNFGG